MNNLTVISVNQLTLLSQSIKNHYCHLITLLSYSKSLKIHLKRHFIWFQNKRVNSLIQNKTHSSEDRTLKTLWSINLLIIKFSAFDQPTEVKKVITRIIHDFALAAVAERIQCTQYFLISIPALLITVRSQLVIV